MPDVYILEHAVVTEKRSLFRNRWRIMHHYIIGRWAFDSYEKAVEFRDARPYVMLDGYGYDFVGSVKVSPFRYDSNRERTYDAFQIHRLEVN